MRWRTNDPLAEKRRSSSGSSDGRVVAIVLSHQRRDELLELLASLEASHVAPIAIIVFDNASTDGSAAAVAERFPAVEVVHSDENLGVAEARNRAWCYAEAHHAFDYLLFLDDDTFVTPECIGHLVRAFDTHPSVGVLGVKAFVDREQTRLCSAGICTNSLWTGDEVRLEIAPVDPRSLFRGNYARLAYTVATVDAKRFEGPEKRLRKGEVVYVSLEEGKGEVWHATRVQRDKPHSGLFLRGRLAETWSGTEQPLRVRYGIEAWFAPKARALEIERAARRSPDEAARAFAVVAISASGRAALARLDLP